MTNNCKQSSSFHNISPVNNIKGSKISAPDAYFDISLRPHKAKSKHNTNVQDMTSPSLKPHIFITVKKD